MMQRLAMVVLVAVLSGCGAQDGTLAGAEGPDGTWVLVEGVPLVDGYPVTLEVTGEEVGGTAACNSYGGAASITADSFSVGDLAHTEMGCPEPGVHESESSYLDALARVESWQREGDELVLTGGEDVELRYAAEPQEPDAPLAGTRWELSSLLSGTGPDGAVSSTMAPGWLELAEDGSFTASDGCNEQDGTWEEDGTTLRLTTATTTDAACEGLQQQIDHVAAVFGGNPERELAGRTLTLEAGEQGLQYGAAD